VPEVIPARRYLIKYVYYYLTPCIPLSFKGEREGFFRRGALPLLNSPLDIILNWREGSFFIREALPSYALPFIMIERGLSDFFLVVASS